VENPKSLDTQQIDTQNTEVGSSTKQEFLENLEKPEVSTHKEDTTATEASNKPTKIQEETLIKKGEDRPLYSPEKSTTSEVGKQLST
jgi:hypothetical protein